MAEYVEKSKIKQYVKNFFIGLKVDGDKFDEEDCCETICQIIDFAPAADVVEFKHAYYEVVPNQHKNQAVLDVRCSNCQRVLKRKKENYCPHCGAKMDGGKNGKKIEDINCLRRKPDGVQGF